MKAYCQFKRKIKLEILLSVYTFDLRFFLIHDGVYKYMDIYMSMGAFIKGVRF